MMEFVNELMRLREARVDTGESWDEAVRALTLVLAPFAPYLGEELWARLGQPYSVHQQPWPCFDPALLVDAEVEMVVQVNGKIRDRVLVAAGADEETVKTQVLQSPRVQAGFDGKTVQKIVVVPGKLVNIVAR
jgi:leucyl-tRNA synthetase